MEVQVQLFSILRDCLPPYGGLPSSGGLPPDAQRLSGQPEATEVQVRAEGQGQARLTLPQGTTLADLMVHLGIDCRLGFAPADVVERAGWQVTINGQYEANMERELREGDFVRVFPPVAGG